MNENEQEDQENTIPSTIETNIEVIPQNPFTIDIPNQSDIKDQEIAYPGYEVEENPGFFEVAKAEFKNLSTNYHALHALNAPQTEPAGQLAQYYYPEVNDKFYQPAPPGWSPKEEIKKQNNIDTKFLPRLMDAKNPRDFQYRLDDSREQEHRDIL